MGTRRRSFWGWGWEDAALAPDQQTALAAALSVRFEREIDVASAPELDGIVLPPPRLAPPPSLAPVCSQDPHDRAGHTYGKGYRDVVRGFRGEFPHPPDVVAFPASEAEVASVLDWCSSEGAAAVPYGGGSSVVGGVECTGDGYAGVVSVDLSRLASVLEIDRASRAARIQAGVYGPALEDQLRPHGLTLRHFPQSFEFSTLGGWLATRSGGHYATNMTYIDDFVECLRVVTPAGVCESRRLPGSGAGPSPDRMFLGSEGTLGVITEAWVRLQDRPRWRASAGVRFPTFERGVEAARAVAQAGLYPANCRLLDAGEAATSAGVGDGSALLVLGFESADHAVDAWMARGLECCADHGGLVPEGVRSSGPSPPGGHDSRAGGGAVDTWRGAFLRAQYGRDALISMAMIAETFETATTWSAFPTLHAEVRQTVERSLAEVCGAGTVTCRFTHLYPDGPAPYFTIVAPGRRGSELAQWDEIKAAASDAVLAHGGTITHHHAVGRDHRAWYDRQRPAPFAEALRAAKRALDPAGVLNPGVLIDPLPRV